MYFILGFFIALSLFLSMQSSNQERAAREMAAAHQLVKEAEAEYPRLLASYENAYGEFDRLMEEEEARHFPRKFSGKWIPKKRFINNSFIEFSSDGLLVSYKAPNGASCFRANNQNLKLVRYAEHHYIASNKPAYNRFKFHGDKDALSITTVHRTIRPSTTDYVRIDYREEDQYNKCERHR